MSFNHQKASLAAAAAQVSIYNMDQELPTSSGSSGTNIFGDFPLDFFLPLLEHAAVFLTHTTPLSYLGTSNSYPIHIGAVFIVAIH